MANIVSCPSCQKKLRLPDDLLGQDVQCPTCSATFPARAEGSSPAHPDSDRQDHERRAVDRPHREWEDADDYDDDSDARRGMRRDLDPHRGAVVLTFGILSLVFMGVLGLVFGLVAWLLGNSDMREIREGRMDPEGEGVTNAGRICGIIGTILSLVVVGICCVWIGLAVGIAGMGNK